MLYIIEKTAAGMKYNHTWHVGEPLPLFTGNTRVLEFQADGDELDMILEAMKGTPTVIPFHVGPTERVSSNSPSIAPAGKMSDRDFIANLYEGFAQILEEIKKHNYGTAEVYGDIHIKKMETFLQI